MMLALADVEADVCPGCGGFISQTTVHDHGHHITTKACSRCEALARFSKDQAKLDEVYENVPDSAMEELRAEGVNWVRPEGRRIYVQRIPLPEEPSPEQA